MVQIPAGAAGARGRQWAHWWANMVAAWVHAMCQALKGTEDNGGMLRPGWVVVVDMLTSIEPLIFCAARY